MQGNREDLQPGELKEDPSRYPANRSEEVADVTPINKHRGLEDPTRQST